MAAIGGQHRHAVGRIRRALEILTVVCSDRRQPCATTSNDVMPSQPPGGGATLAPRSASDPGGGTADDAARPEQQ